MTYDDYKLMSDREGGTDCCVHYCHNGHAFIEHSTWDDEGRISHACEYADEAQPFCETCAEWVWNLVDGVSLAAELARNAATRRKCASQQSD